MKNVFWQFIKIFFTYIILFLFLAHWLVVIIYHILLNFNLDPVLAATFLCFLIIASLSSISMYCVVKEDNELKRKQLEIENIAIKNQMINEAINKVNEVNTTRQQIEYQIDILNNRKSQLASEFNSGKQKLDELNQQLYNTKLEINAIKTNTKQYLTKLHENNTIDYPWLADLYADIAYIEEMKIANYLETKKPPAISTASEIKNQISKEKRHIQKQLKMAQNQLNFYETVFPWLEEFKEIDPIEAYETIRAFDSDDEYARIKNYISAEEFQRLSTAEKYQLALDRWKNKPNKKAWQIGIEYESYIGYVYECKGYKVTYNGALKGLEDMGRDIIAENDKEILVVQCKYWKKEKTIHEKHIFQLYGTVVLEKMQTKKKVKGVFITSATLSETALAVAKELKIEIKSEIPFDKNYPCIKCNINRTTGEKIYHLPFDQQYNTVHIEPHKGECYVKTTKEAEERGFRHAFKHIYS